MYIDIPLYRYSVFPKTSSAVNVDLGPLEPMTVLLWPPDKKTPCPPAPESLNLVAHVLTRL